ncbi:MAG: Holliday junction branch migration protein RuvA [Thermodesulfovibrionales bacterium]
MSCKYDEVDFKMIGTLRGILSIKKPEYVIIDCHGVGYKVILTINTLSTLPDVNNEVFLHIHTYVKEDCIELYGFTSDREKRIFISLLGVSGIGPKTALNVLSTLSPNELQDALDREDVAMLCKIPGLGKKTAQRLILELRERLPKQTEQKDILFEDTLSALINLGYKKADAVVAIKEAQRSGCDTIESLIKEALKHLTTH